MKKLLLTLVLSFIVTAILGITWHLVIFGAQYEAMNFITRETPIFPLGLLAGFISVFVFALVFHRFATVLKPKNSIKHGILSGIVLITLPKVSHTLLHAAEHDVGNIGLWILLETLLFLIVGVVSGTIAGLIYRNR